MNRRTLTSTGLVMLSVFAFAGAPGHVGAAESTPNKIVDYETIIASLNTDGSYHRIRMLDDLRVFGTGDVTITDPSSTDDLRNLLGYHAPDAVDNAVRYHVRNLDGSARFLTLSRPDKLPPLAMSIVYGLNGRRQDSGKDLVGESGDVTLQFTVRNTTSRLQTVHFEDATGNEQTAELQIPLPIVAQLQLVLPPDHFSELDAPNADIITDPTGNKIVNWSMVMIPPIGDLTQTFTLKAHAEDFTLGQVRLVGSPTAPDQRQFLRYAETQLGGGVDSTASLYSGSVQISDNLDQLHAGTLDLVDGMEQLLAGSQQLTAGLNDAFSGSGQLASGLDDAAAGSGQLTSGLQQLEDGSNQLTSGLNDAVAGVGTSSDPATASIAGGVAALKGGLGKILGGLEQLKAGLPDAKEAALGIKAIALGLAPLLVGGPTSVQGGADAINSITGQVGPLLSGAAQACAGACTQVAAPGFTVGSALLFAANCLNGGAPDGCGAGVPSINAIASQLSAAAGQLATCLGGIGINDCGSSKPSISTVAGLLAGGVDQALAGLGSTGNANSLIGGTFLAEQGAGKLLDGLGQLRDGLEQAFSGSGKITAGLGLAHNGSTKLTSGLRGQAAPGAHQLADGLGQAHDGSGQITDGLGQAKGGAGQIEQGVYAINELGVKEVGRSANDTSIDIGQQLAMLRAQDDRAAKESLLYGPPTSDQATTVVGGSSVVLVLDALDGREAATVTRNIYVGVGLLLLLGFTLLGMRGRRRGMVAA